MEFIDELRFLKEQLRFSGKFDLPKGFDNVVLAGMGGSGISEKIFQEAYHSKPVYHIDDYAMPDFVSKSTLFIAASYSGNTEETITAAKGAKAKGAFVVTISSAGQLSSYGDVHVKIPRSDLHPRSAVGFMIMPLLRSFGLVTQRDIEEAYKILEELDSSHKECIEHAKAIAKSEGIPVIYGAHPYKNVAYRWKTQFNENSKVLAYSSYFPELNHNDTLALEKTYRKKDFYFMVLDSDDRRIKRRIEITEKITGSKFNLIKPKGKSFLAKLLYFVHYGDYVSYELAMLRGVDPAETELIGKLKGMIEDQG